MRIFHPNLCLFTSLNIYIYSTIMYSMGIHMFKGKFLNLKKKLKRGQVLSWIPILGIHHLN